MIFSQSKHTRSWHPPPRRYSLSRPWHLKNDMRMNLDPFVEMEKFQEISTPSIMISSRSMLPAIVGVLTNAVAAMTSFATSFASMAIELSIKFQDIGETLLAAFFVLSFLQAAVAMYQYRYDVRGQLVFPTGPTFGVEDAGSNNSSHNNDNDNNDNNDNDNDNDNKSNNLPSVPDINIAGAKDKEANADRYVGIYGIPYFMKKLNKSLLLLLPWLTGNIHTILTKNSHLFHIGFIITLVRFLEDTVLGADDGNYRQSRGMDERHMRSLPSLLEKVAYPKQNNDPIRVLVIGDSLAVGLGCLEEFDPSKDNSWPMTLVENTRPTVDQSSKTQPPVFPQMLARTLSSLFHQPVHWRSGGVDGGDVNDIRQYCMDIIIQECAADNGKTMPGSSYTMGQPDIIIVLFGMNDLKNLVSLNIIPKMFRRDESKDGGGGIAHHFRQGMEALISDIKNYAPDAYIVFPQLPIQTFHKNSIVNILPLGFFVDIMVGFWERQKKRVMEGKTRGGDISERNTMYIDLTPKEIAAWYCNDNKENDIIVTECYDDIKDDVLISADGVHPNKRMYAKWSESLGKKMCERIMPQLALIEKKQHLNKGKARLTKTTQMKRQSIM